MPFAAAISEHPITAHAVGEVAGAVLERIGERPDVTVVFVTPPHAGALEDVLSTVDAVLHPLTLVGAAAESVVGPHIEVEATAAVTLFAATGGPALPVWLEAHPDDGGRVAVAGWPEGVLSDPRALLLVADPFTFSAPGFLSWFGRRHPGVPVVGGLASVARGPGGNRLGLGTTVRSAGAVGVLLGPGFGAEAVVSQGCRPFGHPLVITKAEGNVIFELAGRPALGRLVHQASEQLTSEEVDVLEHGGLQIGLVVDEHRAEFGPGDFLIRSVLGADRANGAVAIGDTARVGTTVQFHLRDARSAEHDLRRALSGRHADAALLFTCNGRGTRLFGRPGRDAEAVAESLGPVPLAGCFAAGEFGPVGDRNFLHGSSASALLLREQHLAG